MIWFSLFLKNGMLDISRSKTSGSAYAKHDGFLYFLKSVAVTLFTTLSVHCADITTATRNWNGVLYFSSLFGFGYFRLRYATIFRARIRRPRSLLIGSRSETKPSRRSPGAPTGCLLRARVWRGRSSSLQ